MDQRELIYTLLNLSGWGPGKVFEFVKKNNFDFNSCLNNLNTELTIRELDQFENNIERTKRIFEINNSKQISQICILDKEFPRKLYESSDKCVFLFYKGNIELLSKKAVTIIGTRKPETEFIDKGNKLVSYFSKQGYVIVSGLAVGCDTLAHSECLNEKGKTIAVLPSDCEKIYPASNKNLAKEIVDNDGLLISEYSVGEPMNKYNFARRDRIQSLLSSVVLIIQASNESGTMIATKKSIKDGKFVYAIEGNELALVRKYVNVDSEEELKEIEAWII